jgi:uncharacterized protein
MKYAIGKINKILIIRLQRGDDMLLSIEKACSENDIKNAVIISVVGSLNGVFFFNPRIDTKTKCGISYGDPIKVNGPVEILSAQGEVCHEEDGKIGVHVHATFSDSKGGAYGGHLTGEGNKALNTVNIFIGVVEGVDMGFEWDDVIGLPGFYPKQI